MRRLLECVWFRPMLRMLAIAILTTLWLAQAVAEKPRSSGRSHHLDYYVSTTGSDANDGSERKPWATIQHAGEAVTPGATVHVRPGTYRLSRIIETRGSGTASARVRFVSDERWGAKLVTSASQAWANMGAYVDIEGFDISSSSLDTAIGIHSEGEYDRVIANRIHDMPSAPGACPSGGGIMIGGGAAHQSAVGNIIYNLGPPPGTCNQIHGIYVATANCAVVNNITFHNAGKGIHLWGPTSDCLVANNTSFANQDGMVIGGDPAHGGLTDRVLVVNNIAYKNVRYGIYEYGATGPNNRYLNNLVYGNPTGWALLKGSAANTINADPQFVNYTGTIAGDYHLRATSPAVGSGTSVGAPDTDFDLAPRKKVPGPDIGAYEAGVHGVRVAGR